MGSLPCNSTRTDKEYITCKHGHTTPIKIHYFFVDKDLGAKKVVCKSSSTTQVKQCSTVFRNPCLSSSDSHIGEVESCTFTPKTTDGRDSCVSIKELEKDLTAIREQLYLLTKNKNIALSVTNELHGRYKCLVRKNEEQQKTIDKLRRQLALLCKKKSDTSNTDLSILKQGLTKCEEKLEMIYNEFVKDKSMCSCAEKSQETLIAKLNEQIASLQGQLEQSCNAQETLEHDTVHMKDHNDCLEKDCSTLRQELENAEKKLAEMDALIVDLKEQLLLFAQQRSEQEDASKLAEDLRKQLELKDCDCQQLDLECKKLRDNLESLNDKNGQLNSVIADLQNRIEEFTRKAKENDSKNQINQNFCKQLDGKIKLYEERDAKRLKELQNVRQQNGAVLMELQRMKKFVEDGELPNAKLDYENACCRCSVLPESLQTIINTIYSTLVKVYECEKNCKILRQLMAALSAKDRELAVARNEIDILKHDLQVANDDNNNLAMNLMCLQGTTKTNYIEYVEETVQVECSCEPEQDNMML